jgi:hypothetical protein
LTRRCGSSACAGWHSRDAEHTVRNVRDITGRRRVFFVLHAVQIIAACFVVRCMLLAACTGCHSAFGGDRRGGAGAATRVACCTAYVACCTAYVACCTAYVACCTAVLAQLHVLQVRHATGDHHGPAGARDGHGPAGLRQVRASVLASHRLRRNRAPPHLRRDRALRRT